MKRTVFIFCAITFSLIAHSQTTSLLLFKDSLVPKFGVGDLYSIQQSPIKFEVAAIKDSLIVNRLNHNVDTTSCNFSTRNGQLIGHDYGEWGGSLVYSSNTGRTDTVYHGNVQHIFTAYHQIYFTSSLWHLSLRYGQLYSLDTTSKPYHAKLAASFEYPIREYCVIHDTMYLVTDGTLYRMQYGKAVSMATVPFSCNSIAVIGRYMYFGLHGAYAQLDLKSKKYRYFVYTGQ
jgi:hypothetical protein